MRQPTPEPLRKPGRPPAGPGGAAVRDMPRFMLRLPAETLASLRAWSAVRQVPAWRLIDQAVRESLERLQGADAEDVRRLARRYQRTE